MKNFALYTRKIVSYADRLHSKRMATGKMKGVIVMLQEERLVVGEGVLLTK